MKKLIALAALAAAVTACADMAGDLGRAGATPGGAQDIGYAREQIDHGLVPRPEAFTVEGLLSEHDLPIAGGECEQTLCVDAAAAIAPNIESGRREAFIQIGFSSNVDLARFKRRALNVAAVVDVSGSMDGGRLDAVKVAVKKLIDRLDANDRFTLVAFDDESEVIVTGVSGAERSRLKGLVDDLDTGGGTCIECGLRDGYAKLEALHSDARDSRIMLFTDARPNVGATGEGEFIELVKAHSDRIGITAFGVGIDFGHELALAIGRVRGGNYFFLESLEKTETVFDGEFDMLVTPLAYDLNLELKPGEGFAVEAVHGVPTWKKGDAEAKIEVATVFLSKRRGAILARLSGEAAPQAAIMNAYLGFTDIARLPRDAELSVAYDGAEPLAEGVTWYSQQGVLKTVALTNLVLGAQKACRLWWAGDEAGARAAAELTRDWMKAEADATGDEGLGREAALAEKLLALMTAETPAP